MAKRVAMVMAIAALLVTLVAGVAVAKTFVCDSVPCSGTEQSDQIGERKGSVQDDIRAKGGDDTINVRRYGNDSDAVNAGSGNDTISANDGDTRDVIQCGDGTDTAYIDVVYDATDPTMVKSSDKVYNCEKVYDQTGKEVPSLENLVQPTTTSTTTSTTTDSADTTTSSPSTTTSSDKSKK